MTGWIPLTAMILLNLWASVAWIAKKDYAFGLLFFCYAVATGCFLYKDLTHVPQ